MNDSQPPAAPPPPPPLWAFVPHADYTPPALPVRSAAAQYWATLLKLLRREDNASLVPARQEQALRALSDMRLAHLVRPIDWAEVSQALDLAIDSPSQVTFVIGQPHAGHAEIVEAWAQRHGARLIEPPSAEQILGDDPHWLVPGHTPGHTPDNTPSNTLSNTQVAAPGAVPEAETETETENEAGTPVGSSQGPALSAAWALPQLEHCFLRHADGLALVRRLLAHVASGQAGHGLIGCDSWAWAYLQLVWPLPQPAALTLQPADAERLRRLFVHLSPPRRRRPLRFRNARTGSETMSVPPSDQPPSDDLVLLAAHCRGNMGIAREYWRWRLRAEPDADVQAEALDADAPEGDAQTSAAVSAQEVWVSAALGEPQLPTDAGEEISLLLHALLLHGGLPEAALMQVLPLPPHQVMALLLRLQRHGLVEQAAGRWRVAPLAYVLVRAWLRGRDYLTDDF